MSESVRASYDLNARAVEAKSAVIQHKYMYETLQVATLPCSLLCELQVVWWWSEHYISEYDRRKQKTVRHHLNHKVWRTVQIYLGEISWSSSSAICCEESIFILYLFTSCYPNQYILKNDVEHNSSCNSSCLQAASKKSVVFFFHFLQGLQIIPSQDFLWKNI